MQLSDRVCQKHRPLVFLGGQVIIRQPIIPTAHCSDGPLFRQPIAPTAHFSDNPLFRQKWSKVV